MQRGTIQRVGNCWLLRYREKVVIDGKPTWTSKARKLATYSDQYRNERDVAPLAESFLRPINARQVAQETSIETTELLDSFLNTFVAHCEMTLKPATASAYRSAHNLIKPSIDGLKLQKATVVDIQRIIDAIDPESSHAQFEKVKAFLSSAYRWGRQTGKIPQTCNPVVDSSIRGHGKVAGETHAYTLAEIQTMLSILGEPARTAVLTAALTGLSRSEIEVLRWEDFDFDRDQLTVRRGRSGGKIVETKVAARKGSIPMLPVLAEALREHKARNSGDGFVFHGVTLAPINLQYLAETDVVPKVGTQWHGWHAFRRGLATNLYALGASDKTVQAILRHSNVKTTMAYYMKPLPQDSHDAMAKLGAALKKTRKTA